MNENDRLRQLASNSAEILKQANIDYVKSDTGDFCYRNMLLRYLRVNNKNKVNASELTTEQLEKEVDKVKFEIAPWQMSMVSTPAAKEEAVGLALYERDTAGKHPTAKEIFSVQEEVPAGRSKFASDLIDAQKPSEKVGNAVSGVSLAAACAVDNPLSISSCTKALNIIKDEMTPKGRVDIIHTSTWKRVLASKKYDEGIRLAALKVADRLENRATEKTGNVFEDISESFKKSGMSAAEATNAAWDVMALIGNQGPNIGSYATFIEIGNYKPKTQKSKALGFIAAAMPLLDQIRLRAKNELYSYPSGVETTCDNSKPYHFWMSAALSRKLVLENKIDPAVAAQATFLAQRGYQMNRDKSGDVMSSQGKGVLGAGLFSPVHQVIRTDFAYGAAGASFGSESMSSSRKKISVDGALVSLMENAGTEPASNSIFGSQVDSFRNWNSIFSPYSAMDGLERPKQ